MMIKCKVKSDNMGNITVYPIGKRYNYPSLFFQEGSESDFLETLSKYSQKAINEGYEVVIPIADDYWIDSDYEEQLDRILPHGSGIDCKWEYSEQKDGKIVCNNSFHYMNDNGYYMGYLDFSIRFFRNNPTDFILQFHTNRNGYREVNNHGLREYFYDIFDWALKDFEL